MNITRVSFVSFIVFRVVRMTDLTVVFTKKEENMLPFQER